MAETYALTELDQSRRLRICCRLGSEPEPSSCPPEQGDITDRFGGGQEQQLPCAGRKRLLPAQEALLDAAGKRRRVGEPETAGEVRWRQPLRQLEQRQWVAAGLREDAVPHLLVHWARDGSVE